MPQFLVTWMIKVDAENEEKAALMAADNLPSTYSLSQATKFGVVSDEEIMESMLSYQVTHLDLSNYFIWLRDKVKEEDET